MPCFATNTSLFPSRPTRIIHRGRQKDESDPPGRGSEIAPSVPKTPHPGPEVPDRGLPQSTLAVIVFCSWQPPGPSQTFVAIGGFWTCVSQPTGAHLHLWCSLGACPSEAWPFLRTLDWGTPCRTTGSYKLLPCALFPHCVPRGGTRAQTFHCSAPKPGCVGTLPAPGERKQTTLVFVARGHRSTVSLCPGLILARRRQMGVAWLPVCR